MSYKVGSTIYSKNVTYKPYFPIVGTHPYNGQISTVSWRWSFSYRPAGLVVYLCQDAGTCVNVTYMQSGSTTTFAGKSPMNKFYLQYSVAGTGYMSPAYGNNNQLIVNYNIP